MEFSSSAKLDAFISSFLLDSSRAEITSFSLETSRACSDRILSSCLETHAERERERDGEKGVS